MKCFFLVISLFITNLLIAQVANKTVIKDAVNATANDSLSRNSWQIPKEERFTWVRQVQRIINLTNNDNKSLLHIVGPTAASAQTITTLLLNLLRSGHISAYSDTLDTTLLSSENAIKEILTADTFKITQYILLESWRFDSSLGQMNVKILGIAPCYPVNTDSACQPIVWFKYYLLHPVFETYGVAKSKEIKRKHFKRKTSLADYFDMRYFSGKIVTVTPHDSTDRIYKFK